jgi:hypothetical protein
MNQQRNLGLMEARAGLTLLTCLLATLGYTVLQRLGGANQSEMLERRPSAVSNVADTVRSGSHSDFEQPQILTAQGSDSSGGQPSQSIFEPHSFAPEHKLTELPGHYRQALAPPGGTGDTVYPNVEPRRAARPSPAGATR